LKNYKKIECYLKLKRLLKIVLKLRRNFVENFVEELKDDLLIYYNSKLK